MFISVSVDNRLLIVAEDQNKGKRGDIFSVSVKLFWIIMFALNYFASANTCQYHLSVNIYTIKYKMCLFYRIIKIFHSEALKKDT